jgi:hypothetical protein
MQLGAAVRIIHATRATLTTHTRASAGPLGEPTVTRSAVVVGFAWVRRSSTGTSLTAAQAILALRVLVADRAVASVRTAAEAGSDTGCAVAVHGASRLAAAMTVAAMAVDAAREHVHAVLASGLLTTMARHAIDVAAAGGPRCRQTR